MRPTGWPCDACDEEHAVRRGERAADGAGGGGDGLEPAARSLRNFDLACAAARRQEQARIRTWQTIAAPDNVEVAPLHGLRAAYVPMPLKNYGLAVLGVPLAPFAVTLLPPETSACLYRRMTDSSRLARSAAKAASP